MLGLPVTRRSLIEWVALLGGDNNVTVPVFETIFIKEEDSSMERKLLWIMCALLLLVMVGCAKVHFGVQDKALIVPDDVALTEEAIAKAEKSPGAKVCPEKIGMAKSLAKQAMETYWACHTTQALEMLAKARGMAKEVEACKAAPPAPTPAPAPAPVTPPARTPISFHSVTFDFNKSDLKPAAKTELDRAAKIMMDNPDVVLELQGHTDSIGTDKYNVALGHRRANEVFKYLNAKGVKSDRLKELSFGKVKPVASNATEDGRAQNRRVELVILK
jgi:outer membrane protein OmpA-like peptidoglycan-associated protein